MAGRKISVSITPFKTLEDARHLTQNALQDMVNKIQAQPPVTEFGQRRLTQVVDPQAPDDAATKNYVDKVINSVIPSGTSTSSLFTLSSVVQTGIPPTAPSGTILWVSDFDHIIRYNGSGWQMIDGGNLRISFCVADPGIGWHLCDGSTVAYLNANCVSTSLITLPDLRTAGSPAFFKTGDTYTGSVVAAVTPTATNPSPTGTPSTTTSFTQGAGATVTVASPTHTHTIGNPTVSLPGDPVPELVMLPYFRI